MPQSACDQAFSLVEIVVVVGLLSVIVLGLMGMFNQTQRAFRLGMTQTDVLASGRIATDLIVRELEETTPTFLGTKAPATVAYPPNFLTELRNVANTSLQLLPGVNNVSRTNIMDDVFFLTRQNLTWKGVGYFVRTNGTVQNSFGAVGTLYRYETNSTISLIQQYPDSIYKFGFLQARINPESYRASKMLDGVVHFRVRTYDPQGFQIVPPTLTFSNIAVISFPFLPDEVGLSIFRSNAVPASVEVELGILEPAILERYKSIPTVAARAQFLSKQAAHVHLFRQRVSIRNVDASAYQ